jgi:hypothetical protein
MKTIYTVFILLICVNPIKLRLADNLHELVVLPSKSVDGRTQVEWSRVWWQWAGSFKWDESPVADKTGYLCGSKQAGPVWFLAGTYGTQRTIRTCKVPRGKYLFFPLINYVVMPPRDRTITCTAITNTAERVTNNPSALVLEIDGVQINNLESHRLATKNCFDIGVNAKPKTRVYPSAANGYYAMLKPLPPGRHTINFGGILPSMMQAVSYTLEVD